MIFGKKSSEKKPNMYILDTTCEEEGLKSIERVNSPISSEIDLLCLSNQTFSTKNGVVYCLSIKPKSPKLLSWSNGSANVVCICEF